MLQVQREIAARCQDRVRVGGKVGQQARELGEGLWRVQLVQIIDHQGDAVASIGELRQYPVDHRPPVEAGCRCRRFGPAGWVGGPAEGVEQGEPELLGVVLVALHLHDREPVGLARTVGPGAQQRRLSTTGGSRDDRHLRRRGAIQRGEEIAPVDQPGSCRSHLQMPALVGYA